MNTTQNDRKHIKTHRIYLNYLGFYVKGIDPVEYFKEKNYQQKKKKPYKRR